MFHRYIQDSNNIPITKEFLENGHYQLEVMGKRFDATLTLKSPLDPENKRVQGIYDDVLPIRQ